MAGGGYKRQTSGSDTTTLGKGAFSTRGFVLQDDDVGDKFVTRVRSLNVRVTPQQSDVVHGFHTFYRWQGTLSSTRSSLLL